ncbi:hypothetical protein ABEB36_013937 [Hypothenemus hampei]|uniref:Ig-like domain-containing protein n=1 Tax=Hypothenemus hampei TaxID=57062 RepID=A0ABD1E631_HYPHA
MCLWMFIVLLVAKTALFCPTTCECKWKNGKESVFCISGNFSHVPLNLDGGTQVLDLTNNRIQILRDQEFNKSGLVNLQRIYLSKCHLRHIESNAFDTLINLIELDLSDNVLTDVPSHSFQTIPELRELKLNGNPIQRIVQNTFAKLKQLVRLEMSFCQIASIELNSFLGLDDSLEWLKLDSNHLSILDASVFKQLHNLHGLELSNNPWNCTCQLRNFRNWMLLHNIPYDIPPTCRTPKRLQGKSWKTLDLDEFACPPFINANVTTLKSTESNNATLKCGFSGIPLPKIKWFQRNRAVVNLNDKKYYLKTDNATSELIIFNTELQDAGQYLCSAENQAGKSESVITLIVARKSNDAITFSGRALSISAFLVVLGTFFVCSIVMCSMRVHKTTTRPIKCDKDNYGKIELNMINGQNFNRSDDLLMTIARKNGYYSVLPGTDSDQDDGEESAWQMIPGIGSIRETKWTTIEMNKNSQHGQSSRDFTGRNITKPIFNRSTHDMVDGTVQYKGISQMGIPLSTQFSANLSRQPQIYTSSAVRQVPDVVSLNSITNRNNRTKKKRGSSETHELCSTFPSRKSNWPGYRSNESQMALLAESRCSSETSSIDISFATRRSLSSNNELRHSFGKSTNFRNSSNCSINLRNAKETFSSSSSLNSTPLLDIKGLENRLSLPQPQSNSYDYHAMQLEKFLKEYRMLQKQLTKMKDTCDSICQGQQEFRKDNDSRAVSCSSSLEKYESNDETNSLININAIQDSVDFKNFQEELTIYLMSRSPSGKNFSSTILQ